MELFNNSQKISIDNKSLNYYREGSGETLLFVHGITTYSFIWQTMIPFFKNDFEVIVIDLFGCGDSDKLLDEDISLKRQAHLIAKFCKAIGISKVHLVCHDVGGGIGQIIAVNYPDLLHSLVLINSVAYNFWPVQPIIAIRTPIIRQIAMAALDMGMFEIIVKRGLFYKTNLSKELMQLFWKPMKTSLGRKGFLHFAKCLNNNNLTEIEAQLKQLCVRTLIIRGEADVYLSSSISNKLYAEIPKSELVLIETGGHFIQIDEPYLVSKAIIKFIDASKK